MRFCEVPGCSRPHRSRGLCEMHYQRQRARTKGATPEPAKGSPCQHLRCPWIAVYRVIWPSPINRREKACEAHMRLTEAALMPSIKIERIGSK